MDLSNQHFTRLDHRYFKAFIAAAETENFTLAAERANMTQSGVSQQIAKLEEQLGAPLFKRLGKNVCLSPSGEKLVKYIKMYLEFQNQFFQDVQEKNQSLDGRVSYAMPPSCILSPHFPLLLDQRKHHQELDLKVDLVPNNEVFNMVQIGKVDFGFVTEKVANPLFSYTPFCQEEYIMVAQDPERFALHDGVLQQKFVFYPGVAVYLNYWIGHFFPHLDAADYRSVNKSSEINTIDGAILMVKGGMGISVFPRHCVQSLLDSEHLYEFKVPEKDPLLNNIFIVELSGYQQPYRVKEVIRWFLEMKVSEE